MKNLTKKLPLAIFFALALIATPALSAGSLTWTSPTPANNTLLNVQTVTFNVSSDSTINSSSVFEWRNQSDQVVNLSATQLSNASASTSGYIYITINNMLAGRHQIKAYVVQNITDNPPTNSTFAQGQKRNITIDLSADTISITDPVAATTYRKKDTDSNLSIQLNFSVSNSGLATSDTCNYDILCNSGTPTNSVVVANTTISCTITSLGVTPLRTGSECTVEVYQNDTASNLVRSSINFNYAVDATGGGSVVGGGSTSTPTTVGIPSGTTPTQPGQPGTPSNNGLIVIGVIGILGYLIFFKGKKKGKRK